MNANESGPILSLSTALDDGVATVSLTGEVDVSSSSQLRRELHDLIDDGTMSIVLDFSELTFIDSSGLGALVGVHARLRKDQPDAALVIRNLRGPVRRVFEITGLVAVFGIED